MTFNIDNHLFKAEKIDNIAIVRFKKNLIRQLTNLTVKEGLFKYLHGIRDSKSIKVVVLIGSPEKIKRQEMIEFLGELAYSEDSFSRSLVFTMQLIS